MSGSGYRPTIPAIGFRGCEGAMQGNVEKRSEEVKPRALRRAALTRWWLAPSDISRIFSNRPAAVRHEVTGKDDRETLVDRRSTVKMCSALK